MALSVADLISSVGDEAMSERLWGITGLILTLENLANRHLW